MIALEFIKEEPLSYIKLYFKKIFSFFFIDFNSTYPNYYNLMHLAPKIILSIVSLFGTVLAIKKRGNYQFLALALLFLFQILNNFSYELI